MNGNVIDGLQDDVIGVVERRIMATAGVPLSAGLSVTAHSRRAGQRLEQVWGVLTASSDASCGAGGTSRACATCIIFSSWTSMGRGSGGAVF
jgi:hypothetical protein